jgi:hypothetical protein
MAIRKARSSSEGNLEQGEGNIWLAADGIEVPFNFAGRFDDGGGSNPEELHAPVVSRCRWPMRWVRQGMRLTEEHNFLGKPLRISPGT